MMSLFKTCLGGCNLGKLAMSSFNVKGMVGFGRDEYNARTEYLFCDFLSSSLNGFLNFF